MFSRRAFCTGLGASLATPSILRAETGLTQPLRETASSMDQLRTILVQRGDETLLAEAFRGASLDRVANIKSCSKSILALLLGSAIQRNEVAGLEARLVDVAPDLLPANATEGAADLTMADLVTLRGGLQSTSGPNYGEWVSSGNWVAYALRQPRVSANGGRMIYSTGTTHVLGAALSVATGKSLLELTRERLGQQLDIEVPPWTRDPQGRFFGGNEMALTPNAMLRLAVLMRDGGRYAGRQIIGEDWITASIQPQTASPFSGLGYGLGWFLSPGGWVIARGYGGQVIAAHPRRSLAVAITSDPTRPARSGGYFGDLMRLLEGPIAGLA